MDDVDRAQLYQEQVLAAQLEQAAALARTALGHHATMTPSQAMVSRSRLPASIQSQRVRSRQRERRNDTIGDLQKESRRASDAQRPAVGSAACKGAGLGGDH